MVWGTCASVPLLSASKGSFPMQATPPSPCPHFKPRARPKPRFAQTPKPVSPFSVKAVG